MPCNDVTDYLELALDLEEQISAYRFRKRTCGGAVGDETLLYEFVKGKTPLEITECSMDTYEAFFKPADDAERFVLLKHIQALTSLCAVLSGFESGARGEHCEIEQILYTPGGSEIIAHIKVELETEKIDSCGSCGSGCGSGGGCSSSLPSVVTSCSDGDAPVQQSGCGSGGCGCSSNEVVVSKSSKRLKVIL